MIKFKIVNTTTKEIISYGSCDPSTVDKQYLNPGEELVIDENLDLDELKTDSKTEDTYLASRAKRYPNIEEQLGALYKFVEYMIKTQNLTPPADVLKILNDINEVKTSYPKS